MKRLKRLAAVMLVLCVTAVVVAQMAIPKQPASNGLYYKPDSLADSDAFVWDDTNTNRRFIIWTIKQMDEAGNLVNSDAAILAVHVRPKKHLTWLVDPEEVSDVVSGDLPHQIGKRSFGGIGLKGFFKFLALLQTTEPYSGDKSEEPK